MRSVLWKRLNLEGHDACRFAGSCEGWSVEGTAVFEQDGVVSALTYSLSCDERWVSRGASVRGWAGEREVELLIERRSDGRWRVNGDSRGPLTGLQDIDLGFTPASNTNAIRRLSLAEGDEAESVAAWLNTEDWIVKPLPQTYRRLARNSYECVSPAHDFRATLLVDDFGVVQEYPSLWTMARPR